MQFSVYALVATAQLATAHFGIEYPEWRADTLMVEDGPYSQYDYPCELKTIKNDFSLSFCCPSISLTQIQLQRRQCPR